MFSQIVLMTYVSDSDSSACKVGPMESSQKILQFLDAEEFMELQSQQDAE